MKELNLYLFKVSPRIGGKEEVDVRLQAGFDRVERILEAVSATKFAVYFGNLPTYSSKGRE